MRGGFWVGGGTDVRRDGRREEAADAEEEMDMWVGLAIVLLLAGCADVENVQSALLGHQYGFWGGLWHGAIMLFSFIGSLFSEDIALYAVNNNGGWYDFGYFLGVGTLGGGSARVGRSETPGRR